MTAPAELPAPEPGHTPERVPERAPDEAPAWVHGHAHEPNLQTPPGNGAFDVVTPAGRTHRITPADLAALPLTTVAGCYIVSTGHGSSGPFTFGGARLVDLLQYVLGAGELESAQGAGEVRNAKGAGWQHVDVIGADGFGARLTPADLLAWNARPIVLAYARDGAPLTRAQGLVRLVDPRETRDALRQVKWLARIVIC